LQQALTSLPQRENLMNQKLFEPVQLGRYTLSNRLVMAPMTRSRAKADGTPGDLAADYYRQRASIGLIVTEGTQPSADGQGYITTPGIYTDAHVAGWKQVAAAVHDKGGASSSNSCTQGACHIRTTRRIIDRASPLPPLHRVRRCLPPKACRRSPSRVR
jgi:hypothetical protein